MIARTVALIFAILTAAAFALAAPPARPAPRPAARAPATSPPATSPPAAAPPATPPPAPRPPATASASPAAAAPPDAHPTTAAAAAKTYTTALAPLPDDQPVPHRFLPAGSFDPDTGPSTTVFPAQEYTLRFNHRFHVGDPKGPHLKCGSCHKAALTSASVKDNLLPGGDVCDSCHLTDHSNATRANGVTPGDGEDGQCVFCHVGFKPADGSGNANAVTRFELPRANMVFNHKKHLDRNIQCAQCHGDVAQLELATRDQMPRMRGCFGCHQMADSAARGTAKSDCLVCHVATDGTQRGSVGGNGRMRSLFATGEMLPPRWLHDAAHGPDWIFRHRQVAGNDSQFCANCHKEDFCTDCHDGRVKPRSVHPSDYISLHPIEARQQTTQCTSCHREQSFCLECHQRLGIAMSGPVAAKESGRFHPPKEIWSDPPRRPGHHSFEAERNLNQCVSCHIERDCVACHGAQGIGGGFNPHRASFLAGCSTQFRRNPRPCYVCHEPGDGVLTQCR